MRWLLLLLVFPASLAAQADGDAPLFARRALLSPDVRARLGVGVGDYARLEHASLLHADLAGSGKPGVVALMHAKGAVAAAWFADPDAAAAPDSCTGFAAAGEMTATVAPFAGAGAVWVRTTLKTSELETTHCRVLRLWRGRLVRTLGFRESALEKHPDNRTARRWQVSVEASSPLLALLIRRDDELDGESLAGTHAAARLQFEPDGCGGWRFAGASTDCADTAERCRAARLLERDGLNAEALRQAREALQVAKEDGLPADNPRRLEAAALVGRLEARIPAASLAGR